MKFDQVNNNKGDVNNAIVKVGSMSGSALQINSPGATQTLTTHNGGNQREMAKEAIRVVLEVIKDLNLTDDEKEEVKTDAECAEKQLDSKKTKWDHVKDYFVGMRDKILAGISGLAVSTVVTKAEAAVKMIEEFLSSLGK